jgi:hypothetical protein
MVSLCCPLWVLFSTAKPTVPGPLPLAPEVICRNPGFEDVAVQAPQAALGVTVKLTGTSGLTPQFGWPEPLGHATTVDVPVAGRLTDADARPIEHDA